MSYNKNLTVDLNKLRLEKIQLERDEQKLKKIIDLVKTQINAVQIEELELKNRQPLSDDYLRELAFGGGPLEAGGHQSEGSNQNHVTRGRKAPEGGQDILQHMILGTFETE